MRASSSATPPRTLLGITLAHQYFSGAFTAFSFAPLPSTAKACRRLRWQMVQDGARLSLHASAEAIRLAEAGLGLGALALAQFCWQVLPKAREFATVTAPDAQARSQTLAFTPATPKPGNERLTVGPLALEQDTWPRQPLAWDLPRPASVSPGAALRLETGAGIALRTLISGSGPSLYIDVSDFGPGLYRLSQPGRVLAAWFADDRGANHVSPGAVIVFPGSLLSATLSAAAQVDGAATPPAYTATFAAREVLWRYHVFNATGGDALRIEAVKARNDTTDTSIPSSDMFTPVSVAAVPGAQSFEATVPHKLAERPAQRYALRSGKATRYSPLPLAGLQLARSARGASQPCSEIFVYL